MGFISTIYPLSPSKRQAEQPGTYSGDGLDGQGCNGPRGHGKAWRAVI